MNFSFLSEQLAQQDAIEWLGLITGILYVLLAVYERPLCWVFGIISSACIGWKSFTDYLLVADGILQVFYIIIGAIGLVHWIRGTKGDALLPITILPFLRHVYGVSVCLAVGYPISVLLVEYAGARYGYLDTVLTLLSIWATVLLVRKDLHNWVYWILVDIAYTGLYWKSEGYLFALLFVIYTFIAIWGWSRWRKAFNQKLHHSI